ncbi:hypothetical protein VTK73DRAFT_8565 [Phialemonium thermophilum]|uniref:Uncharacterized protein n=1 Tax=Phialemonium thermophilum TaxID=223376 RepID=A0ABR3XNK7_9PEZI
MVCRESLTEIIKSQSQTIQALSVQGRGYGVVVDAPRIIHGNKYELDPPILEACKIILALANVVKNTGTVPREEPTEWVLSVKYAQQSRRSRERHSPRSRSSDRESFVGHQASQRRRSPSSTPSPGRPSGATEEMMTPSRSNAKRPPKRRRVRSAAERPLRENHPGHITHVMRMTKDDSSTASSSHVKGGFAIESESGPSRTWKANDMLTSQSPVDSEFIYVEPMDEIIDLRDLQDKKWDSVVIDVSYLRNTARHQVSALSNPGLGANLIAEEKALSLGLKIQPVESAGRNMYVLYEDRETMKKQHITGTVHIYWWPTQPVHARPITLPLRVCRSLPSNLQQRIILGKPFDSRRKHYIKAESLDAKDTGQDATI